MPIDEKTRQEIIALLQGMPGVCYQRTNGILHRHEIKTKGGALMSKSERYNKPFNLREDEDEVIQMALRYANGGATAGTVIFNSEELAISEAILKRLNNTISYPVKAHYKSKQRGEG